MRNWLRALFWTAAMFSVLAFFGALVSPLHFNQPLLISFGLTYLIGKIGVAYRVF